MNSSKTSRTKASATRAKESEYVSFPTASKMLGVGISTVRGLAKSGKLKTFSYGGKMKPRIVRASILALLAKKQEA